MNRPRIPPVPLLLLSLCWGGCDPLWHHRVDVYRAPRADDPPEAPPEPLSHARVRVDCSNTDFLYETSVSSNSAGEAGYSGLGYGIPRGCTVEVSKDGFRPRRYHVAEFCTDRVNPLEREAMGRDCRWGLLRAELTPFARPAPSAEPTSPPPPPTSPPASPPPSTPTGCRSESAVSLVPGSGRIRVFTATCGDPGQSSVLIRFPDGKEAWSPLPSDLARDGWKVCGGADEAMPGGSLVGLWFCQSSWSKSWRALFLEAQETGATLRTVFELPAGPSAAVRMKDLDADGIPELRVGRPARPWEQRIETFRLAASGFVPWSGEPVGPWVVAARAACVEHAESTPHCDPVLDVETSSMPLPAGRTLVLVEGPRAECGTAGCPVSAWLVPAKGGSAKVVDGFGFIGFEAPTRTHGPPCFIIDGASTRSFCWDGGSYRPLGGKSRRGQ